MQKPDLQAFVTLAAELGVEPSACLFVGDNPMHDVGIADLVTEELTIPAQSAR